MTTAATEALAILAAVAAGHDTPERIAEATEISVAVISRRLRSNGSCQFNTAFRWFVKTDGKWGLTQSGANQLKGAR